MRRFQRSSIRTLIPFVVLACSDDDTIVAVNVTATDAVPVVERMHVTIVQASRMHVAAFTPPTETPTGANAASPSIKNSFFERISLPNGWEEERASVQVDAQHADGSPFDPPLTDNTTVVIQPGGVVAAFVKLGAIPSTGGQGGSAGSGGTAGTTENVGGAAGNGTLGGAAGDANHAGTAGNG